MKKRQEVTSTSPTRRLLHGGDINVPLDITVEILKILPTKSIVRFQCVSKLWSSIISRRRDFIDSIITRSLTQPPRDAYFISSKSYTECYLTLSSSNAKESILIPGEFRHYLRGLVCYSNSGKVTIYNLTTRQSFNLPETKTMHMSTCFLEYDPIENQYKVLLPCQVFTLGETRTKKWKTIHGVGSHLPLPGGVCINGTIYYQAGTTEWNATSLYKLMSFDVRSEEFYHVDAPKTLMDQRSSLINYQGKLGFACCAKGVEVWVMETQGWSKILSIEMEGSDKWRSMGVNRGGEIVFVNLAPYKSHEVLCVLYYDLNRNSKRYVELEGIYPKKINNVISIWTVPDFVENTMRLY
ncbi:putative F-box protein [Cardamine amara subsp. amara]|uniref:F-box protein n=1 Tax=Cardamine amara subsp. amara TaxID=228776 RepID=A0ABD1AMT9_CARAN